MLDGFILCVTYTTHVMEHDNNNSFPIPTSKLLTPINSKIIMGICKCTVWHTSLVLSRRLWVEIRYPVHRRRCQVSCFFVIRATVLSISDILNLKVTASNSAAALDYIYFLRVALNYWVSN